MTAEQARLYLVEISTTV